MLAAGVGFRARGLGLLLSVAGLQQVVARLQELLCREVSAWMDEDVWEDEEDAASATTTLPIKKASEFTRLSGISMRREYSNNANASSSPVTWSVP